jgi:hypothetical protein
MPSFRTKRGTCRLGDRTLELESSLGMQLKRYREGNRLLFASLLSVLGAAVGLPVVALLAGDLRLVGLYGGAFLVVSLGARVSNAVRGFTSDDEIPLDAIRKVRAVRGTKGLTRPRFVVRYERDGEEKRRYVMMPSLWLSYGPAEFERARECFEVCDITVEA